ncbi:ATP-binding cassette domain-containing protein [Malacoplasma muris]|uniref:ATP-binding cassette domain-containing protein n=1 Tax=Malacoplasma muris TaxID=2119 RepID=UPI00398F552A
MNKNSLIAEKQIKAVSKPLQNTKEKPLLSVKDLNMIFRVRGAYKKVLDNISFDVNKGDFFGIIGESGSGKTTTGKVIIKLHQASGGVIEFDNELISQQRLSISKKRWMHKNIQMIFQDPMSSMDPIKNVLKTVSEPLVINGIVQKESIEFIKKINIIKKYFKYTFHKANKENLLSFKKDYFESLINIYKKWTNNLVNYNLNEVENLFSASEVVDSILSDLLDDLQLNMEKTYVFTKKQMDLIDSNINKYNEGKLDQIDIELYKASTQLRQVKNLKNKSAYYIQLNNDKNKLSNFINEFENDFYSKYLVDNKNYFKVLRAKIISNIKSFKQEKLLSKDNFLYLYYLLQEYSYRESKNILNSLTNEFKYLSAKEIDSLVADVEEYRVNKYNSILTDLLNKKNEFDKSNMNKKIELIKSLDSINEFVDQVKVESKQKFIIDSSEIYMLLKSEYSKLSNKTLDTFLVELATHKSKLEDFNIKINDEKIKIRSNKSASLEKWKKDYFNAKENYKSVAEKRNKIILDWKKTESDNKVNYQNRTKEIKEIIKNSKEAKKAFKAAIVKFLDKFSEKEMLNTKSFFEKIKKWNYIRVIRKSLNPKWKTQKIINYQYRNAFSSFRVVTLLHDSHSIFSWIWYFWILKIITVNKVYNALTSVGLKHEHAYRYPHEFSGGQRQRIVIARALITKPKLIIADEPISALDVSIQSQVINIMKKLAKDHGVTFLFIAHDLSMVSYACNKVIIMHNGKIVEKGDASSIFKNPIHPYTKTLFNAAPELSKIHVDLASFDEEMTYDKSYGPLNQPKFELVNGKQNHQVLATPDQIKEWLKK